MDLPRITPGAAIGAGELTTFYSYESSAARSLVLANLAWLLAGRQPAGTPVLMIDWDLESPSLHHLFGGAGERPGLLEYISACRTQIDLLAARGRDPDAIARHVLDAVDWRDYVERVDPVRPLYFMRAGRFDDSYGERAAGLDFHALFHSCPALMRQWRHALAQSFRHVFIDARCGRSAAVSVCTSLLAHHIVGLFSPAPGSLDGLCGVLRRAIAYRCSHEEEQRPLLLYPLPCLPDSADLASCTAWRTAWRRGLPGQGGGRGGYQGVLEALMGDSYGHQHLSLESYCNDIQLGPLEVSGATRDLARRPPGRALLRLLDCVATGKLPWQSHAGQAPLRASGDPGQHQHGLPAPATALLPPQFPALRPLGAISHGLPRTRLLLDTRPRPAPEARSSLRRSVDLLGNTVGSDDGTSRIRQLLDAVELQLSQLQQLVDQQALVEARPLADSLRKLVLRPPVAQDLRRRGAALIKQVYRHDNDTDALLAFTQDELAALERVLNEAATGRPLAFS